MGARAPSLEAEAFPETTATAPAKPGWFPNRVEIGSATVRDANLMWKGGSLEGAALKIAPGDGGWNIASQSGRGATNRNAIAGCPELAHPGRATARFSSMKACFGRVATES